LCGNRWFDNPQVALDAGFSITQNFGASVRSVLECSKAYVYAPVSARHDIGVEAVN
jgi:hypothetical protein